MASLLMKMSYQRLEKTPLDDENETTLNQEEIVVFKPKRSRRFARKWRRPRIRLRISSLRFRVLRRKVNHVGTAFRVSVKKVVKRFKEGKPYIGDLFAGNYMFMQVAPSPLEKKFASSKFMAPKFGY